MRVPAGKSPSPSRARQTPLAPHARQERRALPHFAAAAGGLASPALYVCEPLFPAPHEAAGVTFTSVTIIGTTQLLPATSYFS